MRSRWVNIRKEPVDVLIWYEFQTRCVLRCTRLALCQRPRHCGICVELDDELRQQNFSTWCPSQQTLVSAHTSRASCLGAIKPKSARKPTRVPACFVIESAARHQRRTCESAQENSQQPRTRSVLVSEVGTIGSGGNFESSNL